MPAGVPVIGGGGGELLPPPHDVQNPLTKIPKTAIRSTRRLWPAIRIGAQTRNTPNIAAAPSKPNIPRNGISDAAEVRAVVVMLTVAVFEVPLRTTEFGEAAQVDWGGNPAQFKDTVPLKPGLGVSATVNFTVSPAEMVAAETEEESEKSGAAVTVTAALALLVGSATLVAVTM